MLTETRRNELDPMRAGPPFLLHMKKAQTTITEARDASELYQMNRNMM